MKRLLKIKGLVAALATAVGLTAFAAFAQTAPQITSGPSVTEAEITDSTAVVRWQTNVESTTVVNFGKTSALGQEFKKIVPIEDTETMEISHSMTLWGLDADTTYFYQARSSAGGAAAQSAILQFRTKAAACTADTWDCGAWGACARGTDGNASQSRVCTMKDDCPTVSTPKPAERQACILSCTADTWTCGEWGSCSADGNQARSCTLTVDCSTATTPKPADSRSCTPSTAAPAQPTEPPPAPPAEPSPAPTPAPPVAEAQPTEPPPAPPASPSVGVNFTAAFGFTLDASKSLDDECVRNGILPERCAVWLEAKHADSSCAEAGIFSRESCEKYLSDKAGGTFPGCEGKTIEECDDIKLRATIGYLPEEEKKKVDELVLTKKVSEVFDELGSSAALLIAVSAEKKDEVKWWPSSKEEGQETAPGFIIFDADKDGLPDDVEKRMGYDWRDNDSDDDGVPDGKQSRDVLKEFFEKGDKPTQGQFSNMLDSLSAVDRSFILGNPIGQPLGDAGTTDTTFAVTLESGPAATDREIIRCTSDDNCPPEYPFCHDGYCYGDGYDANSPAPPGYRTVDDDNKDVAKKANVLKGKAAPNTTVLLYVYSYIPMVLTTTTDDSGNFSYDLSDNVVDGQHEVYVAVTDDTGKVAKKSEPLAFFVKGAIAATSEEDFLRSDVNVQRNEAITNYSRYYLYGTIILVLVALGFGWRFVSRMKGEVKA